MKFPMIVNYTVSLFMLCNPLTAIPVFLNLTSNRSMKERRRVGYWMGGAVALILAGATWVGAPLLGILGIRVPAFQCAGGIVVFLLGLSMLYAQVSPIRQVEEEESTRAALPIVPLAIPLMAGPGALSGVIVMASSYRAFWDLIILSLCGIFIGFVTLVIFHFASQVERRLGPSGLNIITRVGGLILASLAVEIFTQGIEGLFFSNP